MPCDPVTAAAKATLARLAVSDPEAARLGQTYNLLDVRPVAWSPADMPTAAVADLAVLRAAIRATQPVSFAHTGLSGNPSSRTVLPLALVLPPQGVKLLAQCQERQDFRQFFVRAMRDLTAQPGDFGADRMTLLEGLFDKESWRD